MSTSLRSGKLIDNCTPSISYDSQVQAASTAFDRQMYEIIDETGQVCFIPNIMGLTDPNLVDILAWQFNVDGYDTSRSLDFRKNLVQQSIIWHKTKGTVALVQHVLDTYWPGGAMIEEWFDYMEPFPPNYPTIGTDVLATAFTPSQVVVASDLFSIVSHGLIDGQAIRFALGQVGNTLPSYLRRTVSTPLSPNVLYYVLFVDLDSFKLSSYAGGQPFDMVGAGTGTNNIYKKTGASWHDRYRFRITVDQTVISPADEWEVLELIDRYKPVSRWCEGIIRPKISDGYIGWAGACLRFISRESDAPSNREQAEGYHLNLPVSAASGPVLVYSDRFTVALPTLTSVDGWVTVTPSDGEGGSFVPATAKLSNLNPVAEFVYKPVSAGNKVITVTNDGGLDDPPPVNYVAKVTAVTYTLVGPASGYEGVESTVFTVALPTNTITTAPVTITPSDGGAGGTFTPASVQLYQTLRSLADKGVGGSATFTYTPKANA